MERCFFAKKPPIVEVCDGHILIRPAGGHCEIAVTPHTLRVFMRRANKVLAEFTRFSGENVLPMGRRGRH